MINLKKEIYLILNCEAVKNAVGEENIFAGYPEEIQTFPCICYTDDGQNDVEFADNLPNGSSGNITIHIYTKKLNGYMTSFEIGAIVFEEMRKNFWTCTNNFESPDVDNNVEHRIMNYRKDFLS